MDSSSFFTFWLPILAILVVGIGVYWTSVVGVLTSPAPRTNLRDPVAFGLVLLATVLLGLAVIPGSGWGFLDDDHFLHDFFYGRPIAPPIWPDVGRFFPLGHQEWRLFYPWTHDIIIYQLWSLSNYLALGLGLVVLMKELQAFRGLGLIFILTLSPLLIVFSSLIIPDRISVTILPWLLYFLIRWDRTLKVRYLFLTLICAHMFLYVKEPNFVFVAAIAGLRLLPPGLVAIRALLERRRDELIEILKASSLDIALLVSCAVFVGLYVSAIPLAVLSSDEVYGGDPVGFSNIAPSLRLWLRRDPMMMLLLAIGGIRLLLNVIVRRRFDVFDQVTVAAAMYLLVLSYGGTVGKYFGALPAAAAAFAVSGALASELRSISSKAAAPAFEALCILGVAANLVYGTPALMYRQDWITRNHETVAELQRLLPKDEASREVFVRGDYYDARMLIVYGDVMRDIDTTFQLVDEKPPERCYESNRNCVEKSPAPGAGEIVLDLGQFTQYRVATISRDGIEIWRYDSENFHDLLSVTPKALHGLMLSHYTLW